MTLVFLSGTSMSIDIFYSFHWFYKDQIVHADDIKDKKKYKYITKFLNHLVYNHYFII